MPSDNPLADEPFSYQETNDGRVQVFHKGRLAISLTGKEATRFLLKVETADARTAQLAMAKVTGQFKFGNERVGKNRRG